MIQIRTATVEDAQYIALLGRITFTETFSGYFRDKQDLFEYHELTFNIQKIRTSLKKQNNQYWIAFWNEIPIGYAKLKLNSPTEFIKAENVSQLQKIYVLKEFLDRKVGKRLMEELMKAFKKSDTNYIWLSVLKSNEQALKFYYRNEFQYIGEHTFEIGKELFDYYILKREK